MIIDLIFVILIFFAFVKGLRKGLVGAIFSFAGLFIGLAAALKLSAFLASYLQKNFDHPGPWWPVLAFVLVFVAVGFLIFAVLYTLIFSVVLFYARQLDIITAASAQSSKVYGYIQPWGQWTMDMLGKIIPAFRDLFKDMQHFFEQTGDSLKKTN